MWTGVGDSWSGSDYDDDDYQLPKALLSFACRPLDDADKNYDDYDDGYCCSDYEDVPERYQRWEGIRERNTILSLALSRQRRSTKS